MPTHPDPERATYIQSHSHDMQGLRTVAFGVIYLICGLCYLVTPWGSWVVLFGVWSALGLDRLVTRYYDRTLGPIDSPGSSWSRRPIEERFFLCLGSLAALFVVIAIGVPMYLVLALVGLAGSIRYIVTLSRSGGLPVRPYWAAGSALIALVSLALLLPVSRLAPLHDPNHWEVLFGVYLVPGSIILIVCGLLDHRLLLQTVGPAHTGTPRAAER